MSEIHSATRFRTALFNGIYTEAPEQRRMTMEHIISIVRSWVKSTSDAASSPLAMVTSDALPSAGSHSSYTTSSLSPDATRFDPETAEETRHLLRVHLLIILRMSLNCPFEDVRQTFGEFLSELKSQGYRIPRPVFYSPSFFIPADKITQLDDPQAMKIMTDCFLSTGRMSNVSRLMAYFPSYLEKFLSTFNHILRYQGPLPRHWRNYIAIMAASEHQTQYLVSLQTQEFIQNGGDALWLDGLKYAPEKLQNLGQLNSLMAHQPWMIKSEHIAMLLKGSDNWSMSELVQAIVLMAQFHSLSSFVLGCAIVPEIDMEGGVVEEESENEDRLSKEHGDESLDLSKFTAQLISRLKKRDYEDKMLSASQSEVFEKCEMQETFNEQESLVESPGGVDVRSIKRAVNYEDLSRFRSEQKIEHVDFDVKSSEYSVFRLIDYNWEEQGCSFISKYLPETGDLLDEEFNFILNLTDYSLFNTRAGEGSESVDTWPFRQAIWYYVLRLSGMCHDDYNYHDVNIYLNKRIKQYIKKVACYPEFVSASDFINMGFSFRPDEKVQINLLASEARKCSELLYTLHALMKYER